MTSLRAILRISARNALHRKVNLTIGLAVLLGTALLVLGLTLLQNIEGALTESLRSTLFGDVDVYSADSEGALTFSMDSGMPSWSPIASYPEVRDRLLALPEVKGVVPMGFQSATLLGGNQVDRLLATLRKGVVAGGLGGTPAQRAEMARLEEKVRFLAGVMREDLEQSAQISNRADLPRAQDALEKAASTAFWADFPRDPLNALEFLENRVAPEATGKVALPLFLAGTDFQAFAANFRRFHVVEGTVPPPGAPGLLIPKGYYEDLFKLPLARRLDRIQQALARGAKIAEDGDLQQLVAQNRDNFADLLRQLDPVSAQEMTRRLGTELGRPDAPLRDLLASFFATDDGNFAARYRFFYDRMAPLIDLYSLHLGDVVAVKAEARSGYMRGVGLKLYGTFEFEGLEDSPLVGQMCLTDLSSLRMLLGLGEPGLGEEVAALEKRAGVQFVSKEAALDGLGEIAQAALPPAEDAKLPPRFEPAAGQVERRRSAEDSVLAAVVVLRDPARTPTALSRISELAQDPAIRIKAYPSTEAAGMLGQMVKVGRGVMLGLAGVVFLIIGVILNSAALFVTLRRVPEIGTLRAIGAQRGFVVALVVFESLLVVLAASLLGTAIASGLVAHWGATGIGAPPGMNFFFGGPVLRPQLHWIPALLPFSLVAAMCAAATFYPALLAARVSPLRAMQSSS